MHDRKVYLVYYKVSSGSVTLRPGDSANKQYEVGWGVCVSQMVPLVNSIN